jgi:hypothetical protein
MYIYAYFCDSGSDLIEDVLRNGPAEVYTADLGCECRMKLDDFNISLFLMRHDWQPLKAKDSWSNGPELYDAEAYPSYRSPLISQPRVVKHRGRNGE